MIDFAWFDIALLSAVALRYVLRPERVSGVFHDPFSAAAVAGPIIGGEVAADVAAPAALGATLGAADLAGGTAAALGTGSALGGSTLFGAAPLLTLPEVGVSAAAPAIGGELAAGGAIPAAIGGEAAAGLGAGAALGGAATAGSTLIGSPASTFGDTATQIATGALDAGAATAPVTSTPIVPAADTLTPPSFGTQAPPTTSATPLASSGGGGASPLTTPGVSGADVTAQGTAATTPGVGTPGAAGTGAGTTGTSAATKAAGATSIGDKIIDFAKKNPGLLLSAAPMLLGMFGKPSQVPGQAQLQNAQEQAASMGKTLSAYQLSGTLPAGMQQVVDAKNAADKAAVRSQFAQLGYSGSTAEQQALHQIDQATTGQIALIAQQLASQGIDWTRLSAQEQETLLNAQLKQQSEFSSALGNFAKGLVPIGSAVDKSLNA